MVNRRGVTILELSCVIAIISLLLALLLPAVQSARERARETVCKNNLYQINLAVAQYVDTHKTIPGPGTEGQTGGWIVEILPFIEQQNLHSTIIVGAPIVDAPKALFLPPPIFRCPRRTALNQTSDGEITPGHYVLVPAGGHASFNLFDAPIAFSVPWLNGPVMDYRMVIGGVGPHSNGFFYTNGLQQGGGFMPGGQIIQ